MPNGRYNYDEESVYAFLNAGVPRKVYIYAMVPSPNHKSNLHEQVDIVKQFCFNSGVQINGIFQDTTLEQTPNLEFFKLFDEVIARKVKLCMSHRIEFLGITVRLLKLYLINLVQG